MGKLNRLHQLTGWLVFAIAAVVYILSAERTGSLWDVGEFILGAYKLQVVHPPGAPLFLVIGRLFAGLGDLLSSDPSMIAFFVNAMSGIFSAFASAFVAWVTIRLGTLALVGKESDDALGGGQNVAVALGGLVAGLATTFSTSIWFNAVEGEVYAMSTFFTAMTVWSMVKWYTLPDTPQYDRWLIFTIFASGLSIGVHLLSILTWPALAVLYYAKTRQQAFSWGRLLLALIGGVAVIVVIQTFVIIGIPSLWHFFEVDLGLVNAGLPVHSGLLITYLVIGAVLFFGLRYAHRNQSARVQQIFIGLATLVIAYSVIGVVVIRANAHPPVNMNSPDNVTSLLPYLNREQYGERALLRGPQFDASPSGQQLEDRMGLVGNRYEATNYKIDLEYANRDKVLFPRMSDAGQGRPNIYKQWLGLNPQEPLPRGRPNFGDNLSFFVNYQLGWMYWRYFMWNFSGRQNGQQGFYAWDESAGNWITGIDFLDEGRLGELDALPEADRDDPARNTYYLLPFLFGLLGLFWHAGRRKEEFLALLVLFVITGIGIIVYSNQPPNEPRERDYVLVGSFFTFAMWIGLAVPAIYELIKKYAGAKGMGPAVGAGALVLAAPLLMGFQNWDDHSRATHAGARDYASNFLNSVDPNAIIFTYGDNDTYPLWYAQEVEGIRTDVRVVNLSLIAVDWYIELLRYKMNDSESIDLELTTDQIRGRKRNAIYYYNQNNQTGDCSRDRPISLDRFMETMIAADRPQQTSQGTIETTYQTCNVGIEIDQSRLGQAPWLRPGGGEPVDRIPLSINNQRLTKDEIAILDLINSNLYTRPIYFAVTCQPSKLMGLQDYMQLEGLGLKIVAERQRSDPSFGIIGSGQVNADKTYDLVTETWNYGNFDEVDTHISSSFAPAVQSMQLVTLRTMQELLNQGQTERALALGDRYFEAFPNFNFPFYYQTLLMLEPYFQARQPQRAAAVIEQLAQNAAERLTYYDSIDPQIVQSSYAREQQMGLAIAQQLLTQLNTPSNQELYSRVRAILGPYADLVEQSRLPG